MTPHVTCVCLTADRQKMTDRSVASFLAQTYPNKSLLIVDTGKPRYELSSFHRDVLIIRRENMNGSGTIGTLRNFANGMLKTSEIIAHWDSDDWSHPLRLAWQVNALKSNEALDAVGYRSMLFYDSRPGRIRAEEAPPVASEETGQSWLYTSDKPGYALGTSLIYWRRTWEAHPFREDVKFGEDNEWIKGVNLLSDEGFFKDEPAMIAEMHGANLTDHSDVIGNSPNWARVPQWDKSLAERMRL